jgi:hypothetical protein
MGSWRNVAFVQVDDLARVESELLALVTERGRRRIQPVRRTPQVQEAMQYGSGDEVKRWGIAGFPGAPGWTVVRTAPFELLLQGEPPLISRLAMRLRSAAFQYNLYDSTSQFLYEADEAGRVEKSGFVGGNDPYRYWGPNGADFAEDRYAVRFRAVDVAPVADWALKAMPEARVTTRVRDEAKDLIHWLQQHGAAREEQIWSVHPAHVIRGLTTEDSRFLPMEDFIDAAMVTVFGGTNREHCDNRFLHEVLVTHGPMPVEGFALYAEAD